jgi:hypothetical protein
MIADAFALKFLYAHRFVYIVYPFDWRDEEYTHNSRASQRWEQCLNILKENMRPALEVFQSQSKEKNQKQVEEFAREAVSAVIEKVKSTGDEYLSKDVRDKAVEKLRSMDLRANFFGRNFTVENLEEFFDELELKGDEDLLESSLKIQNFHRKIRNDYRDLFVMGSKSWTDSASQSDLISYNTLDDIFGE